MNDGFWSRFHAKHTGSIESECWIWHGAKGRGYGVISFDGKLRCAHRVAFELLFGKIPDNLELDHLCKNSLCVNPKHLEAVTHSENCLRGRHAEVLRERAAKITHCPKGHPYEGDNLYVKPNGRRECRQCVRDAGLKYRLKTGKSKGISRKSSLGKAIRKPDVMERKSWLSK